MSAKSNYVYCDNCGKEHKSTSKHVVYNVDKLGYFCIKCNTIIAVFTKSELERMLAAMSISGKSAIICRGHVSSKQWYRNRMLS